MIQMINENLYNNTIMIMIQMNNDTYLFHDTNDNDTNE